MIIAVKEQSSSTDVIGEQVVDSIFSKTHTMEFQTSVDLVMNHSSELILLSKWLLRHSPLKILRDLQRAKDGFKQYMAWSHLQRHIVYQRLCSVDLLSSMVKVSKQDKSSALNEHEIVGNIFV